MNAIKSYQKQVEIILKEKLSSRENIKIEWKAFSFHERVYSPRLDIAVGPFSINDGVQKDMEYDMLMEHNRSFIEKLIEYNNKNSIKYNDIGISTCTFSNLNAFNPNSRCWLAIEIENSVSRKHLLGGTVNACALGRVGICIGWTEDKVKAFVRLQSYWRKLSSFRKNSFLTDNLIILDKDQFISSLSLIESNT